MQIRRKWTCHSRRLNLVVRTALAFAAFLVTRPGEAVAQLQIGAMEGISMLDSAQLQTIVWTSNIEAAAEFYGSVLGLSLTGRSHGALVYRVGQGELRVSPVPSTAPSPHTVLGFAVRDLRAVLRTLASRGLTTERFPVFDHDADGVWAAPDGTQVIWFRDPDGNLLSIVQYGQQ